MSFQCAVPLSRLRRRPAKTPLARFVLMDSRALPHGVLIVMLAIVALNLLDAFLTLWRIDHGVVAWLLH